MGDFLLFAEGNQNKTHTHRPLRVMFISAEAEKKRTEDNAGSLGRSLILSLSPGDCRVENIP